MPTNPHPRIPWMATAFDLIGTKEAPGTRNTQEILDWATIAGIDYEADATPWCGLFVSFCLVDNGIPVVDQPLWALSWKSYGLRLTEPAFGCIMVFKRSGGGHVGFAVGEDDTSFRILGGNQSDQVMIKSYPKSRWVGCRWPTGMEKFIVKGSL